MLDRGAGRIGVMVVVPAFAGGQQGDQPIVSAVIAGFVVSITEDVAERIDRPGDVPNPNGSHNDAPYKKAGRHLVGFLGVAHQGDTGGRRNSRKDDRMRHEKQTGRARQSLDPSIVRISRDVARVLFIHRKSGQPRATLVH